MSRLLFSLPVGLLLVLWAALGMGCGTPSLAVVPVTGKVTVGNQPVTSGQVALVPEDTKNHPDLSAGTIDANGEYKIFTGGKEGAPLGKYKVTVTATMVPTGGGTGAPPMPFARKYGDAKETPLHFEVVNDPAAGAYDLKLTK